MGGVMQGRHRIGRVSPWDRRRPACMPAKGRHDACGSGKGCKCTGMSLPQKRPLRKGCAQKKAGGRSGKGGELRGMLAPMKLLSWNVNGLRAVLRKNFNAFLEAEAPDILALQETKCTEADLPALWPGYHAFWNSAEKKGYSGTGILSRVAPRSVTRGMGVVEHDREGRVLTAEFETFYLVNVYVPNSQRELTRLAYRQQWDREFLAYLKELEKHKPVVCCGDLNVAHKERDLARPKDNVRNHGFTVEERAGFEAFVEAGFVDTFREFEEAGGHYTWWSQMNRARERNIGWRIDYFLVSASLRSSLVRAWILPETVGSDHCPVGVELGGQV